MPDAYFLALPPVRSLPELTSSSCPHAKFLPSGPQSSPHQPMVFWAFSCLSIPLLHRTQRCDYRCPCCASGVYRYLTSGPHDCTASISTQAISPRALPYFLRHQSCCGEGSDAGLCRWKMACMSTQGPPFWHKKILQKFCRKPRFTASNLYLFFFPFLSPSFLFLPHIPSISLILEREPRGLAWQAGALYHSAQHCDVTANILLLCFIFPLTPWGRHFRLTDS